LSTDEAAASIPSLIFMIFWQKKIAKLHGKVMVRRVGWKRRPCWLASTDETKERSLITRALHHLWVQVASLLTLQKKSMHGTAFAKNP
jgi:hypothetical protein